MIIFIAKNKCVEMQYLEDGTGTRSIIAKHAISFAARLLTSELHNFLVMLRKHNSIKLLLRKKILNLCFGICFVIGL